VHVIAVVDGYRIEIQIRTHLQDRWAQSMEKLADVVLGRQIKYGGIPFGGEIGRKLVEVSISEANDIAEWEAAGLDKEHLRFSEATLSRLEELLREVQKAEKRRDRGTVKGGRAD
jgi:ppGpp synthetase/RelA/SpoT-type nucleotidyltranferase